MIWAVMVVPILAPRMIPIDWPNCIRPLLISPTTITVVAEEDWIMAVTIVPTARALNRFEVARSTMATNVCPPQLLKAVAHVGHPEEEDRQSTQKRDQEEEEPELFMGIDGEDNR